MGVAQSLIFITVTTLAVCYGWGMRGTVIGGEKGAMLPGALLGIMFAWYTGSDIIMGGYWIFAAVGLMGMTYGGIEPYGETIGMVLHRGKPDYKPKKGYLGLSLKGAQWFSLCAGFLGVATAAMTGKIYSRTDIIIFCALVPLIQEIGYRIFNKPYDKEKKIYPKIYFSLTRREEWGRNAAFILALLLFAAVRSDSFTLLMLAGGFISGGIGWYVAMHFYAYSAFPRKNGSYLFGKLSLKNTIDGWKIMEFTLGAIGGLGVSLTCVAGRGLLKSEIETIEANGKLWEAFPRLGDFSVYIAVALILGIIAVNLYQFILDSKGKKANSLVCDLIERLLFSVIPLCLVLLGDLFTARIMTFFMLFFACAVKCAFDRFEKFKALAFWQTVIMLSCVAVFLGDIVLGGYSVWQTWLLAGAPYLIAEFMWVYSPANLKKLHKNHKAGQTICQLNGSRLTVYPFFIVMIALLYVIGWQLFAK